MTAIVRTDTSVARIHPTAILEAGVRIGPGTAIWDNAHIRRSTCVGAECIVGEKTYIAYDVRIGNRVKINAFVYICNAVTIEDGVMIGAGVVFTNDRYPRATTPDLRAMRTSEPDEHYPSNPGSGRSNHWCRQHHWLRPRDRAVRHGGDGVGSNTLGA